MLRNRSIIIKRVAVMSAICLIYIYINIIIEIIKDIECRNWKKDNNTMLRIIKWSNFDLSKFNQYN
jgi:hypothetical protein